MYAGALQSAGSLDGVGAAAQFNSPADVAQDSAGNVYVADAGNYTVRRISTDGRVTTLAGTPGQAGSADGVGAAVRFAGPSGVAVDAAGNVYVSDLPNKTLRRISAAGVVSTIAGSAGQAGFVDGDAATSRLGGPGSIAVDAAGTIYFVDGLSVRKRASDGTITTFAGNPNESGPSAFGDGAQTRFASTPISVAVDGAGNIYVAEGSSFVNIPVGNIRKFDAQARALPLGSAAEGVLAITYPSDISVDAAGNIYVLSNGVDQPSPNFITTYRTLQRITSDGRTITTLAGANEIRTVDGPSASSRFTDPTSVAVGPAGRVVVGERSTNTIRLVDTAQGVVSTLAGGSGGGDVDGVASASRFNLPQGIAASADGTLYVADARNHSVRKINPTGVVSTLARGFRLPQEVATPPGGATVYIADSDSSIIGRSITAIAPNGAAAAFSSLAPGSGATLAADNAGNVYASERSNVIVIAAGGAKRILASGIALNDLAVDAAGNVFFTSRANTVGVIDVAGNVVIRAGRANDAGSVDGVGQDARFSAPNALAVDPAGNMYVGDGAKIRKVTAQGAVTTIADITQVQGAQAGFAASSITAVNSLAWSGGALYATVVNAVIRITP